MQRRNVLAYVATCLLSLLASLTYAAVGSDPPAGGGPMVNGLVAQVSNGTTTVATSTNVSGFKDAAIVFQVTSGGTDCGTLQVFLQDSADGGVTWNDVLATVPFTFGSAATTQRYYLLSSMTSQVQQLSRMQGQPQVTETLVGGTVRQGPYGNRFRVREVISNIQGSPTGPTYSFNVLLK